MAGRSSPAAAFPGADADFAGLAAARARLDDLELELIDRARAQGATWAEIAARLGVGSRQAAEQRRRRLAAGARARRDAQDARFGLAGVRATIATLLAAVGADPHWNRRFARAALVHATLSTARNADAGPMFALAAQAAADLTGVRLPPVLRAAVADFRLALRAAVPASTSR